jgi:thiol-disulfide isomerase/thioredoxin
LPEIDEWQTELADRVNFVFISTGAGEENVAKFGRTAQRLLVQKNREFQNEVYAKWTPSALLVNTDGRVASHIAAGDSAIRSLIEKVRSENVEDPFFYFAMERKDEHQPKIGESAPEFELKDLEGKTIDSRELRGKPTLVTFWSPTCPHCHAMIEQIKEWEKARGLDDPNLLVFSDGDPEAHREAGITSPILIDKAHGISSKFGMFGTPSAVLIDENGKIVSETAVGASNIWSLIGWRKDQ